MSRHTTIGSTVPFHDTGVIEENGHARTQAFVRVSDIKPDDSGVRAVGSKAPAATSTRAAFNPNYSRVMYMKKKKDCAFTGRTSLLWTSAVAVALFGWTAPRLLADEFSKTAHLSVRMFSTGTLFIDTRTGDLQIEGWDEPRLEIEAEKVVRSGSEASARPLYDVVQIGLEGKDKEIHLSTRYPSRRLWRPFRGESKYSVNFRIKMPYDANLSIKCVNGDVRVPSPAAMPEPPTKDLSALVAAVEPAVIRIHEGVGGLKSLVAQFPVLIRCTPACQWSC